MKYFKIVYKNFELDPRSLKLYRIFFYFAVFFDILLKFFNAESLYSQSGVYPITQSRQWLLKEFHNFFTWSYDLNLIYLQFSLGLILCLFIIRGKYTRIASILLWYFYNSLYLRNTLAIHSAEDIIRVFLFWNMFLPLTSKSKKNIYFSEFFIYAQMIIIYLTLMLQRDYSVWVESGIALVWAFESQTLISSIGEIVKLSPRFLEKISPFIYYFEFLVPPLVLIKRVRLYVVFSMIIFHFGIFLLFNLSMFPFISIATWLLFLPSSFWELRYMNSITQYFRVDAIEDWKYSKYLRIACLPVLLLAFSQMFQSLYYTRVLKSNSYSEFYMESFLLKAEKYLRVKQNWQMFSPYPGIRNGWHNIAYSKLEEDGDLFDFVTDKVYDRKKISYFNTQHLLYLWNISHVNKNKKELDVYMDYLCSHKKEGRSIDLNFTSKDMGMSGPFFNTKTLVTKDCRK